MRRLATALLLGAAGVAAYLWFLPNDSGLDAPVSQSNDQAQPVATRLSTNESPPPSTPGTTATRNPVLTAATPPPSRGGLEGTLTVFDPSGNRHDSESGWMAYTLFFPGGDYEEGRAEVIQGRWSIPEAPQPLDISIAALELGDRPTLWKRSLEPDARNFVSVPETEPLDFEAVWLPELRMRVVDSESGRDLDQITVQRVLHWDEEEGFQELPEIENTILENGISPLRIPAQAMRSHQGQRLRLRLRTPNHAWSRVTMHADDSSERFVALQPGGDLRVSVEGEVEGLATLKISSTRLPTWPIDSFLWRTGRVAQFDGIPAGSYQVILARDEQSSSHVFGQTRVVVEPGQSHEARLTVDQPEPPVPAFLPTGGTVHVPSEWRNRQRLSLSLRATGSAADHLRSSRRPRFPRTHLGNQPLPDDDVFTWHFDPLPPGDYRFLIDGIGFRTMVTIPPSGSDAIHIDVPPPCHVVVRTIDAMTSQPVNAFPTWHSVVEPWSGSFHHQRTEPVAEGIYEFHAPRGRIRVAPGHYDLSWEATEFDLTGSEQEITLPVQRCCRARVVLLDGTTELPWARHWRVLLKHDGRELPLRHGPDGAIASTEPCTGQLTVSGISGYHSPEPMQVSLQRGVEQTITVRLTRR